MALSHRIEYLRKEHKELLHLAQRMEKMLESASKNDFAEHLTSLNELRSLEHGLAGIVEHCHAENRIVASTYHDYLQQEECARIDAEHQQIIRAITNFREELKFATVDRTMAMIIPGMDVVNRLRSHVAYEQQLLNRIVQLSKSHKERAAKKQTGKETSRSTRKHARTRKISTKETNVRPYTLETHPEL